MLKALVMTFTLLVAAAPSAEAASVIVGYKAGTSSGERHDIRQEVQGAPVKSIPELRVEVLRVPSSKQALRELEREDVVRYAEPDSTLHLQTNDTYWSDMWALGGNGSANINVTSAWALSQGAGATVGVIDSGADLNHEDLVGRIATNPGESGAGKESNGIDDDNNGYVDDYQGWDWVGNDKTPSDTMGHGTHVTGIVAALKDNNKGVVGVAPSAKVMPLRVLGDSGEAEYSALIDSMVYAGKMGLKIVNISLAGRGVYRAATDAAKKYPNTLYIAAAGNYSENLDAEGQQFSPCEIPARNVMCVGNSTASEQKSDSSNYGKRAVDILAPGTLIISTTMGSTYGYMSGTSMATPHVAGVAALMVSRNPALSTEQIRQQLITSGKNFTAMAPFSRLGTRLDAYRALTVSVTAPDSDGDGANDTWDNCLTVSNPEQSDRDYDDAGDVCDPSPINDWDKDGAADEEDNCFWTSNPDQKDTDGDGEGDICDLTPNGPDRDNDKTPDASDNCPYITNPDQKDTDGDGIGDDCDKSNPLPPPDSDQDGIIDAIDNCAFIYNPTQDDRDRDGKGDACQAIRALQPITMDVQKKVSKSKWSATVTVTHSAYIRAELKTYAGKEWQTVKVFERKNTTSLLASGKMKPGKKYRLRVVATPDSGATPRVRTVKLR